jgi:hypothetical protein
VSAVQRLFGEVEEESGPSRAEFGAPVNIRLGPELLAQVDAYAVQRAISRAEAVRRLVATALTPRLAANTTVKIDADGSNGIGFWGSVKYVDTGEDVPGYDSPTFGSHSGALKNAYLWTQAEGHPIVGYELVQVGSGTTGHLDVRPKTA